MKAAFFRLPGQVEWRQIDDMRPGAGEVLVRILEEVADLAAKAGDGPGPGCPPPSRNSHEVTRDAERT